MKELNIIKNEQIGTYSITNFQEVKSSLEEELKGFKDKIYTDPEEAASDRIVLEGYKTGLQAVLNELKGPYAEVEKQLDGLLKMVQEPISVINKYEKKLKEEESKRELMAIAEECGDVLGEYKYFVINSPSFIESDWTKSKFNTYNKRKAAIEEKIQKARSDINTISKIGGENRSALLANYYETLTLDNVDRFISALSADTTEVADTEINSASGYKIIKVYGTRDKLEQVYHSLDILGVEFEELEDGMPGAPKEVLEPIFDTFVAFDTENSGTYGGKDKPAELTEIGAVKVVNGQIVDSRDWLIDPQRDILPNIVKLTGIDNEMVKDKPTIDVVIKEFKGFVGEMPFVGHNIKAADLRFILKDGEKNGIAFENKFFDTNKYAKTIKDKCGFEDTKLEYLAGYFGVIDEGHHRADNDARVNAEVYLKLKDIK